MLLINYQCCALGTDWIQWEPRPIHSTATNTTRSCPFHNPPFQLVLLYCPTTSSVLQYPWCCSVSASGTRIHKALYVKVTHKEASFVNQQMDLRSPQLCTEKLSEMNPHQPVYWGVSIHTKPSKILNVTSVHCYHLGYSTSSLIWTSLIQPLTYPNTASKGKRCHVLLFACPSTTLLSLHVFICPSSARADSDQHFCSIKNLGYNQ